MPDESSTARPGSDAPAAAPNARSAGADLAASLQASRELGPDYDEAIAAAIVERLDHTVEERVRNQLSAAGIDPRNPAKPAQPSDQWWGKWVMGLLSMCLVIPLSAIGGSFMGPAGVIMAWAGVIVLYVATMVAGRR
ncbi:hypothetical protein [Streptomonospora litoralis]|uniref:Uncharacterized protein n=1 Tax=Streptomonospora litoralis TaxID=2498135 RepID=A0A4P6Q1W3_9ACTN|nr:hypothetical protein [Streptomonospora litoralis]QBI54588.1 hypothetical protein EKD16_14035 [Streptomonospora litoralis]